MNEAPRDPLVEFARSLPAALDESALHELAVRLQPFLTERQPERPEERLYTAAETAGHVGVNVETVRRAIRSGELLRASPHRTVAAGLEVERPSTVGWP